MPAAWSKEKEDYLAENWGCISIPSISRNLNKSKYAIQLKAQRLKLGPFLKSGEYLTVNQLFKAIGRTGGTAYVLQKWLKLGFPLKKRKVNTCSFNVIYLDDFWEWAEEYRMHIDFSKFPEYALGAEPDWAEDQRMADEAFVKYKTTPWTPGEDAMLESLLKSYRYTYKELSFRLLRTEGAIKRRIYDLKLKHWPIRQPQRSKWTKEQEKTVIKMYNKGYRSAVISEHMEKSEQAINGKIERLIREGKLKKWK